MTSDTPAETGRIRDEARPRRRGAEDRGERRGHPLKRIGERPLPAALRDRANLAKLALPIVGTLSGLVLVLLRHRLLPAKFFFDSLRIQQIALSGRDPFGDRSFENAAYIYRILGLQQAELAAGLLSFAAAALVVWTAVRRAGFRLTWGGALVSLGALGLAGVYLGTYSKDVFVLPVVLVVMTARAGARGWVWVVIGVAAYAYLFRSYWYIVLALFLAFALVARFLGRRRAAVAGPVVAVVVIGLAAWALLHQGADFARTQVNAGRQGLVDATTLIPQYLHIAQPWAESSLPDRPRLDRAASATRAPRHPVLRRRRCRRGRHLDGVLPNRDGPSCTFGLQRESDVGGDRARHDAVAVRAGLRLGGPTPHSTAGARRDDRPRPSRRGAPGSAVHPEGHRR